MLSSYLEAEVSAHRGAAPYERSPARRGARNGRRTRTVSCGVGSLDIAFPKVRGTDTPFRSAVLDARQRTSATLPATLPPLYVEGLSTRDFGRALAPLHEGAGLSRSTASRANAALKQGFESWRRRDLSGEPLVYLFLDGHYEGVRLGTREKEAILVAHGITNTGAPRLLGVYLGCRESADSWLLALRDLAPGGDCRRPGW